MTFNLTTHLVFSLFGIPQSLSLLFILLRTECFCFNTPTIFFYFQRSGKCVCAVLVVFLSHNSLLTKGQILNQNPAFYCHYHILISKEQRPSKTIIGSTSPQRNCQVLIHMVTKRAGMTSVDPTWKRKSKAHPPPHTVARYARIYPHLSLRLWNATML